MSKIALKGGDTGTAKFTLEAPGTNTNRVLTLPDLNATILAGDSYNVGYDNTTSGLSATNVKTAIDELASAPSDQLLTANWTVEQSGTDLVFKYGATTVFKITSAGAIIAADDITAFGSP